MVFVEPASDLSINAGCYNGRVTDVDSVHDLFRDVHLKHKIFLLAIVPASQMWKKTLLLLINS